MAKPAAASYNCAQRDLYTMAKLVIDSLETDLGTFTDFKAKYDLAFVASSRTLLSDAKSLPDDMQRAAEHQLARKALVKQAMFIRNQFTALRAYIAEAFQEDAAIYEQSAGAAYYANAANEDWDSVQMLADAAITFIQANSVELLASGYMPSGFEGDFTQLRDDFAVLHSDFLAKREAATVGTEEKLNANNLLYKRIVDICSDGKVIFATSSANASRYTLSNLLNIISGVGAGGIRGIVTIDGTTTPLENVQVLVDETGDTAYTDALGKYSFPSLAGGAYNVKFTLATYVQRSEVFTVTSGITSNLNVSLTPVI